MRPDPELNPCFTLLEILKYYFALAMSLAGFAYDVIQHNGTTNDSIFYMLGIYSMVLFSFCSDQNSELYS